MTDRAGGWRAILAAAPQADARNDVAYLEVAARRVLNPQRARTLDSGGPTRSPRPPLPDFDLGLNPYLNCELGCTYCYAREFSDKRQAGQGEFDRRIYAKTSAPAVLREELARLARGGDLAAREIALGTATDPYQPYERRARLTRALLEVLATVDGVRLSVTTKSDLVTRDIDVLQAIDRKGQVQVNLSVTTVDRDLARSLEPRAPTPGKRLAALERLTRAGLPAGVLCMPLLPDISDSPRDVRAAMCAAKAAGARWFAARVLFLKGDAVRAAFFGWLERAFPGLVPRYRRWYAGGSSAPEAILDRTRRLVDALGRQYDLPADLPWREVEPAAPRQLSLFEQPPPAEVRLTARPIGAPGPARPLPVVRADDAAASA